ncbi:di-trans,poly-cis-decaprenylcistransferase [Streptomyces finlayi]|uniref:Isoprenyl transferase n=1 Tax=Streptomyces finlayi TaxID=67296 RepID=A0A7G7BKE1_9ACTN|nr:polyprenyl diphosphate synthase [Streptomyces finlayi]QNE75806.1 di-trans,poly-cis-decaprenylcistransferase [Streptomyces finlayi]
MSDETLAGSSELRESYELCEALTKQFHTPMWRATELLPAPVRPYMHAVHGFFLWTDTIADRDGTSAERVQRLARWSAATREGLRSGGSEDPVLRAFVDTVWRWDLDRALVEETLRTLEADCVSPPLFETFRDLRRHLRGVTGATFELWCPLLGVRDPEVLALASLLGEAGQAVDQFEDMPEDLAAGRCYLPRADLRALGLEVSDLQRGERPGALAELVRMQLARWSALLERAAPVTGMVEREYQPFLHLLVLGAHLQFDETTLREERVFAQGLDPLVSADGALRRPVWPHPEVDAVPEHVAVIMDGNRRWASEQGRPASRGHQAGQLPAMRLVNAAMRLGVRHLTLYAFSTENWNRSQDELDALFEAMGDAMGRGAEWLHDLGVRVRWCGRRDRIDPSLASALTLAESMTSNNETLSLTVCLDYGGREELVEAARALAAEAATGAIRPEDIGLADLDRNMYVPGLPDVDLLIRTSGEQRISNFLPWHLSYAEMVFDPTPWPSFGLAQLREAVSVYAGRQRRFGGTVPGPARPTEPTRSQL